MFNTTDTARRIADIPAGMATARHCLAFSYLIDRLMRRVRALTRDEVVTHVETMTARLGLAAA